MNKKYIIVNTSELDGLDFNQLTTTSKDTARKNLAGNKAIIAYFEGTTPDGLSGKTEYTNEELKAIVNVENTWYEEED